MTMISNFLSVAELLMQVFACEKFPNDNFRANFMYYVPNPRVVKNVLRKEGGRNI